MVVCVCEWVRVGGTTRKTNRRQSQARCVDYNRKQHDRVFDYNRKQTATSRPAFTALTHHGIVCFDRCCGADLSMCNALRWHVFCVVRSLRYVKRPHGPVVPNSYLRRSNGGGGGDGGGGGRGCREPMMAENKRVRD